ncbi:methylmalonyl-CoA mutase [Thalassospira alkalitolerans]|uniref:Methylmalonyl-CoA mutase n=1 Tax=Thalassospira alkalitolerans TaxID=1293890 RepID=A0A1Y2LAI7_9PROT|nr:methylmalonyl-CoA mutase [Thalassospira alkalitolerans]OSQ46715.1 methylmalonyl-CoA mutase [Thalassospira alkalitolerans]|tara:strand:- start:34111 stop:34572 length:462 start_codon:yes stop_codon:yes gene_type:complete
MTSPELANNLARFAEMEGRHPRLLVATASSVEERYCKHVATLFADGGFDVDIAPRNSDAQSIARQVIDCDADILVLVRVSMDAEDRVSVAGLISSLAAIDAEYVKFGIVGKTDDPARENVDFVFDLDHLGTADCEALVGYILAIEEGRVAQHI